MAQPRVCVLRAPGTNCDAETAFAFERSGAAADRVHLFRLLEDPAALDGYQILCVPGGFSYGDDVGAGVIFSQKLGGPLVDALGSFLARDTLVLGVCNGFQVLLKAGLLPGGASSWPPNGGRDVTLTWNENGKYTALWVRLKNTASQNVFLRGIDEIELPIAHAEGRLVVRDESVLAAWRANDQIALCYQSRDGGGAGAATAECLPYPDNPNGSAANIAGLCDPTGRVLGLMPHPERFIDATQHPQWTRR
ncbi:MAG TPA: phosphoribosylformylglycinamidine synthase subunit PurQ, partial [Planctomycetaceae bacterium]